MGAVRFNVLTCAYTANTCVFDTSFDYKTDKPRRTRPDADRDSPRLRADHELLWTKELRPGVEFAPSTSSAGPNEYLIYTDAAGARHCYGSDAITSSYTTWTSPQSLVDAIAGLNDEQRTRYLNPPYTIGSAMIWPVRKKDPFTYREATLEFIAGRGHRMLIWVLENTPTSRFESGLVKFRC